VCSEQNAVRFDQAF